MKLTVSELSELAAMTDYLRERQIKRGANKLTGKNHEDPWNKLADETPYGVLLVVPEMARELIRPFPYVNRAYDESLVVIPAVWQAMVRPIVEEIRRGRLEIGLKVGPELPAIPAT